MMSNENNYFKKMITKFNRELTRIKNSYSLEEICNIMGVECPEKFNSVKKKKRISIHAKLAFVRRNGIYFALYQDKYLGKKFREFTKKGVVIFMDRKQYSKYKSAKELSIIPVDDLIEKAGRFFNHVKSKYDLKTIAITGSVGKTTTRQLINFVISGKYKTFCNDANLNSYSSISRFIMERLKKDDKFYIQECGANNIDSVRKSASMLRPDAYVLTNVFSHHLNTYGTIENLFKDKTSFSDYMSKDGVIFTNYDIDLIKKHKFPHKVVSFGIKNKDVDYYGYNIKQNGMILEMNIKSKDEDCKVKANFVGKHNAYNILGAFAVCKWAGLDSSYIIEMISKFKTDYIRQNVMNIAGITFIFDCYNVCNESIKAGIKALEDLEVPKGNKKIAIIGGENKLGENHYDISYNFSKEIKDNKLDKLVCYSVCNQTQKEIDFYGYSKPIYDGLVDSGYKNALYIDDEENLIDFIKKNIRPGDAVLIKGNAELDVTIAIDKVFGSAVTLDNEYLENRQGVVRYNDFRMVTNSCMKAGVIRNLKRQGNIIIPDKIKDFDVYKLGDEVLKDSSIKSIDFGKSLKNIGNYALSTCKNLKEVTIFSNVKFIGDGAFKDCKRLETVKLSEGLLHLGNYVFYGCSNLKEIEIPKSVLYIGSNAFDKDVKVLVHEDSFALQYAKENNLNYEILGK